MKSENFVFVLLFFFTSLFAENKTVVDLINFRYRDFAYRNFYLEKKLTLEIECMGWRERWDDEIAAYGWINNLGTREVIWRMNTDNARRYKTQYLWTCKKAIELSPGYYQVCYAVSPVNPRRGDYSSFGEFLDDLFSGFSKQNWRKDAQYWGIKISTNENNEKHVKTEGISFDDNSLLSMAPLGDNEYRKQGITLRKDTELRIYAVGEGDEGEMYDYGWIEDGKTGEHIWKMDYAETGWAGGGDKNRIVETVIEFPKGDYIIYFVTDGSHSYEEWNRFPPYIPQYWGITLWSPDSVIALENIVQPFEKDKNQHVMVDLTRVGDNRMKEEGFTIKKSLRVRVRCLGEYSSSGSFVDYGWIIDADTRKIVWEMTKNNTDYAGGGNKNRMFNGFIDLEPGDYIAYYRTDGSHSYRDWNTGPPYYPEAWGIKIFVIDNNFNPEWVGNYQEKRGKNIIAEIIRIGNRENVSRQFEIKEEQYVRIYILGEGDEDRMYDYGRLEDQNGKVIWQMEYWNCEHAGGAAKNLVSNRVIKLKPGIYTVRYRTDGSHSYNNWNDDPPRDEARWGITVYKIEE